MKNRKWVVLTAVLSLTGLMGCYESLYRYHPKETLPRMIYVHDEVQGLRTKADLPEDRQMYAEIRTMKGKLETGRLVSITETDLVMNRGYTYTMTDDTQEKVESQISIPKEDVLILKVW